MKDKLEGAMRCARYAFAPNYYHYCGPDTRGEFEEYLKAEVVDRGLVEHLTDFETMYPYLAAIAEANGVKDPLDPRVVEAYWVGNEMLDKVSEQDVYVALVERQRLPKRLTKKEMKWLLPKIDKRARLHHSFHVFNVFTRTGHHAVKHTVETMDECRISWGEILNAKSKRQNAKLQVKSQKLIYKDGRLSLRPEVREVVVPSDLLNSRLRVGDWVSVHWGFVCERLSERQVKQLKGYTEYHLKLANETL